MPCTIKYDMMTKLETVNQDSVRVIEKVFPHRTDISIPSSYSTHKGLESEKAQLPDELKEKLKEKIKWELEMFGYEYI
jgi:hypothetical protein